MISGITKKWLMAGLCLLEIALLFMTSVAFSRAPYSIENAELSLFAAAVKSNAQECYVNVDIQKGSIRSVCDAMFQKTYSENFSKTSTRVLAVSNTDGVASFETSFDGEPLPFLTSAVSGKNYTNNEELVRMETVCINLFEYRDKREEHDYNPAVFNGFAYIPDYYADYILEHYLPGMGYHDLIVNSANYPLSISIDGNSFAYRIANIFHVRGFQQKYAGERELVYNDYDTGAKLDRFFDGYCFVSNYGHYDQLNPDLHISLLNQIEPKKYELEDTLKVAASYASTYQAETAKCDVSFHDGKQLSSYARSSQLSDAFFANNGKYEIWSFLVAGGLFVLYIVGLIALVYSQIGFWSRSKDLLLLSGEATAYMLAAFALKALLPGSAAIQLFFNIPSMVLVCAIFVGLLILFFAKKRKRRSA